MGSSEFCFWKFAWTLRIVFLFSPFPHYQHLSVTDSNNAFKITSLLEVNFNIPFLVEKEMATHSSTLAWKIRWMEKPGRLQSMGSQRVCHTERLHFHFSLSCIGEGNGNPLQRSCLENPRDRGAWWAAVYGVAQSRTWLKGLCSSSSRFHILWSGGRYRRWSPHRNQSKVKPMD